MIRNGEHRSGQKWPVMLKDVGVSPGLGMGCPLQKKRSAESAFWASVPGLTGPSDADLDQLALVAEVP